MTWSTKTS